MDVVPHTCGIRPITADRLDRIIARERANASDELCALRTPLTIRTMARGAFVSIDGFSLRCAPLSLRQSSAAWKRRNVVLLHLVSARGPTQSGLFSGICLSAKRARSCETQRQQNYFSK